MGVTVDAIRKRISRGTIPHERDVDGRVWVVLDTDQDAASTVHDTDQPQSDAAALISAKDETIAALREQLEQANERDRENRRIIAALTSSIPAIEAPSDERESPETVEEEGERAESPGPMLQALRRAHRGGPGCVGCSEDERQGPGDVEAHAKANRKASRAIRGGA